MLLEIVRLDHGVLRGEVPPGANVYLLFPYNSMDTRPVQGNRDNRVQLVYLNEAIKAPNIIVLDAEGNNL